MAAAAFLKIEKLLYIGNGFKERHEICHDDAGSPS